MEDTTKLDIISDIVCPWCIIGYKRIEQALLEMDLEDNVEIEWHPFELNPDMPREGEDIREHIARKYCMTLPESINALANMTAHGAASGFPFDFFDTMRMVNTQDAHLILEYTKENDKQTELELRLFEAFFKEHKDVSDRKLLVREVETIGLNSEEALARLDTEAERKRVRNDEEYWKVWLIKINTQPKRHDDFIQGEIPWDVYVKK